MKKEEHIHERDLEKVSGGFSYSYSYADNDFNEKWNAFTSTRCAQCTHWDFSCKADINLMMQKAAAAYAAGREVECGSYTPLA